MKYAVRYTPNIEGDIKRGWSGWQGQSWDTLDQWWNFSTCGDMAKATWEELRERREEYQSFDTPMEYICDIHEVDDINELDWVDVSNELEELIKMDLRWDADCQAWRLCDYDGLAVWLLEANNDEEAIDMAKNRQWTDSEYRAMGKIEVLLKTDYDFNDAPYYLLKVQKLENIPR